MATGDRINSYLARCGLGSRRSVERLIFEGKVYLNGQCVDTPAIRVNQGDSIKVGGKSVKPPPNPTFLLFNKPPGCLCSKSDPGGRRLIYDWLPKKFHKLHYIGRLDFNTTGLLILTDDGAVTKKALNPQEKIPRTYWVKTHPVFKKPDAVKMKSKPVYIDGLPVKPIRVLVRPKYLEITVREGKNREIRKLLESCGYRVKKLHRVSFGRLYLDGLGEGRYRKLAPPEIPLLFSK